MVRDLLFALGLFFAITAVGAAYQGAWVQPWPTIVMAAALVLFVLASLVRK